MKKTSLVRSRALRLESLESRELLSVAPGGGFLAADAANLRGVVIFPPSQDCAVLHNSSEQGAIDLSSVEISASNAVSSNAWVVTSEADVVDANDGVVTLREAINNSAAGDTITFDDSLGGATIALNEALPLDKSVTIDASALWNVEYDAPALTISGNGATRLFEVAAGTETNPVAFKGLTFADGCHSDVGGAIWAASGYVTVENSVFTGNRAGVGGAIYVEGADSSLTLTDCDFSQNAAQNGEGGRSRNCRLDRNDNRRNVCVEYGAPKWRRDLRRGRRLFVDADRLRLHV